jgi:hypothetical protein
MMTLYSFVTNALGMTARLGQVRQRQIKVDACDTLATKYGVIAVEV